ncbi:hypothetical protein [Rhodopila sp.]|uniref:hypothetical protein n=1 Tax=Rhodopila sp. TaxID=2480087 RepID=UPI003D0E7D2F
MLEAEVDGGGVVWVRPARPIETVEVDVLTADAEWQAGAAAIESEQRHLVRRN